MPIWLELYLQGINTYWLNYWFGKVLLLLPLIVMTISLWAIARFLCWLLDRRSRESVRCRKCWYDLRGTPSSECPECGADLSCYGAWKTGHPQNSKLLNYIACLSVLILLFASLIAVYFKDACELRILDEYSTRLVFVHPKSKQYDMATIYPVGSQIAWPWTRQKTVNIDTWGIRLIGRGRYISIKVTPSQLIPWDYYGSPKSSAGPRTPDYLANIMQADLGASDTPELRREIKIFLDHLEELETQDYHENDFRLSGISNDDDSVAHQSDVFGQVRLERIKYFDEKAPWSVIFIPLTVAGLIWIAGVLLIRRVWIKRSLIGWPIE